MALDEHAGAGTFRLEPTQRAVATPGEFRVQPYGYLRALEVLFAAPLENMDAANPWIVELRVRRFRRDSDEPIPTVLALVEDLAPPFGLLHP